MTNLRRGMDNTRIDCGIATRAGSRSAAAALTGRRHLSGSLPCRPAPTIAKRFFKTASHDPASGAVDARCVSPALIPHAQVPSGPTAIVAWMGPFPGSSAVITTKAVLVHAQTGDPVPKRRAEIAHDRLRVPRCGGGVLPASKVPSLERLDRRIDQQRLAQVARQGFGIVAPRRHVRIVARLEAWEHLGTTDAPPAAQQRAAGGVQC